MALIFLGKTECALCGSVLNEGDDIFATSHFISDRKDPLWRYSDAGMHQACFLAWDHRRAFIEKYNETVGPIRWGNGISQRMLEDGTIIEAPHPDS